MCRESIDEIDHPSVREVLRFLKIHEGVEIHHDGDLPARTGLGSSSSFTVGLLNSLYALKGQMVTKERLAREAIHVEQDMIKENVGCQDQTLAAYGGFNLIEFGGTNHLRVQPLTIPAAKLDLLQDHLMLFFTGFSRNASTIAKSQIENIPQKKVELARMHEMVREAVEVLNGNDLLKFGRLLDESWKLKRTLSDKISSPHIDDLYSTAIRAGAVGGKLLGAGGGGFVLFFVEPSKKDKIRQALKGPFGSSFQIREFGQPDHFLSTRQRFDQIICSRDVSHILAGGLGKRLHSVTGGAQKVLAKIGDQPFLEILIDYIASQGGDAFHLVCRSWQR